MRIMTMLLYAIAFLPLGGVKAAGVLNLSHTEITLGGNEHPGRLEAENTGDSTLYLTVSQELVQTPLSTPEVRIPVGELESPTLLVSPQKLILGPGQKRVLDVRVLRLPRSRKIWRITFRPRERLTVQGHSHEGVEAPLSVSVGYGVVIYQLAKE